MTLRVCATASLPHAMKAEERTRVCAALSRLGEQGDYVMQSHAALHIEGSLGAGDLIWDFELADEDALSRLEARLTEAGWSALFETAESADQAPLAALSRVEAWRVEAGDSHVPLPDLVGIKRTNLVRVRESAAKSSVEQWLREVIALPDHVPAIRNWSLARVHPIGPTTPRVCWTHAWEQEFETLEGLVMDYMMSPYHWGWLDGWYDPEMAHSIVEPDLAHLYCEASGNVLSWTERQGR